MGRAPCCDKVGIKRGRWTAEEDHILSSYIQSNGEGSWRSLPKNAGLKRCGKSCRLRWINYLRSDLKRGNIAPEEEELVVKLHSTLGNRWSLIASHLPGRTDNEIKNYWNSHLSRRLHNFIIRKPSSSHDDVPAVIMNIPPAPLLPPAKRRAGRTSRSAMKPKTHNPKARKTKRTCATLEPDTVDVAAKEAAREEALMVELSVAEAKLGSCEASHEGGDNFCNNNSKLMKNTKGDNVVWSFDDDIMDILMLDEADPDDVFTLFGGDDAKLSRNYSEVARGYSETSNQGSLDCLPSMESFIWQEGSLCNEKKSSDSIVSWLLDGDDDATIGKSNCDNFGGPLDHDEENALVAWLLS